MRYKFGAKNYNIATPPSLFARGVMAISRGGNGYGGKIAL